MKIILCKKVLRRNFTFADLLVGGLRAGGPWRLLLLCWAGSGAQSPSGALRHTAASRFGTATVGVRWPPLLLCD